MQWAAASRTVSRLDVSGGAPVAHILLSSSGISNYESNVARFSFVAILHGGTHCPQRVGSDASPPSAPAAIDIVFGEADPPESSK